MKYIDRGGELVYAQPFEAKGVHFYGFLLWADKDVLQEALCDRYLNNPSGGATKFRPAAPLVLLAFCKLDSLSSDAPPYKDYGWFSEQEAAIWVLTVDEQRETMLWSFPYIWVDNPYAMAMGREIYGFPKGLGTFEIPSSPEIAEHFSVDILALKTFSPETEGTIERVIQANRVSGGGATSEWAEVGDAGKAILKGLAAAAGTDDIWGDLKLAYNTLDDLIHGRVPFVFLKQFRDVADGTSACYQSIVEVTCKMTQFHGGGLLGGEYEVEIADLASHPLVADLGLAGNKIKPVMSYWNYFDFEIGPGVEIWKGNQHA
jgi:hypothetical protein